MTRIEGAIFYSKHVTSYGTLSTSITPGRYTVCTEYKFYDRTGKYIISVHNIKGNVEDYLDHNKEKENVIESIPNAISYKKHSRNTIFTVSLKYVNQELIADKYDLYDQNAMMIKSVYATINEIDKYLDKSYKLKPIKVILKHHDNYTQAIYVGVGDLKLLSLNLPFMLNKENCQELFNNERFDKDWCLENIDRIKIDIIENADIDNYDEDGILIKKDVNKQKKDKCIIF